MQDLLEIDIERVLNRHVGIVLEQDVGATLGLLATIARELAHADADTTLNHRVVCAALTDQAVESADDHARKLVWRRIIRRASREPPHADLAHGRDDQVRSPQPGSAW